MNRIVYLTVLIFLTAAVVSAQGRSVYSSLTEKGCKTLESNPDEGGSYLGECRGIAGYKIQVLEGDIRQSINVIDPAGRKTELNLWSIRGGFSSLGEKAEWRIKAGKPTSLIVRFNVSENPEDSSIITSYLVVVKITRTGTCVTDLIKPSKNQNIEARRTADLSANSKCGFK